MNTIKNNPKRNTPRHILIKLTKIKDKEKIVKAARVKQQVTQKGTLIRLSTDFSTETLKARRKWHDILKLMKGKKLQPKILHQESFHCGAMGLAVSLQHQDADSISIGLKDLALPQLQQRWKLWLRADPQPSDSICSREERKKIKERIFHPVRL